MKSFRENPNSEANQTLTRENEMAVFTAKMEHTMTTDTNTMTQKMTNLTLANEARLQKILTTQLFINGIQTTWREEVMRRIQAGGYPACEQVYDNATRNKLAKQLEFKRKQWLPLGNECHPETIAFNELKAKLVNPLSIMKPEYRIYQADGERSLEVPKLVYDYAVMIKEQLK